MNAYFRPGTLAEALAVLEREPVTIAAGCTDLFAGTEAARIAGPVLDISGIADLRGITRMGDGWRIGATTTWADICRADLPPAFDMLGQAAREVGSVQIQTAATVAGNLCNASPAADGMPPLLALSAEVEVASSGGRRRVPLAEFVTGVRQVALKPGELVTGLVIPPDAGQGRSRFLKLGSRKYLVISIASVAVRLVEAAGRVDEIAISVGSCSPVALRLTALEQHLAGAPLRGLADAVAPEMVRAALAPISDVRGDAAYREDAALELVARALRDLSQVPMREGEG